MALTLALCASSWVYANAEYEPMAPAAATGFEASLDWYSELHLSITVPTTCIDGSELTHDELKLTYGFTYTNEAGEEEDVVLGGGVDVYRTGYTMSISAQHSDLENAGFKNLYCYFSNDFGDGPKAYNQVYTGFDTLQSPAPIALTQDNGNVTLSWAAVDGTVNGGYFEPDQITYTVLRYPDATEFRNLTGTTLTDVIDNSDDIQRDYFYTVQAFSDRISSEVAESEHFTLGTIVKGGEDTEIPAPASITVTPDPSGALSAVITIEAPTVTISGEPIKNITLAELYRDDKDEPIKVYPYGIYGTVTYVDDNFRWADPYTYTVICYNAAGASEPAEATAYVGINVPGAVKYATVVETENPGEVTVSWPLVTEDIDGNPINPDFVSYYICPGEDMNMFSAGFFEVPAGTTSCTFYALEEYGPQQEMYCCTVWPSTESGLGSCALTNKVLIGAPYTLPYVESFSSWNPQCYFEWEQITETAEVTVSYPYDGEYSDISSVDGDHGYLRVYADHASTIEFRTGKINLDCENPILTFNYWGITPDNLNQLTVYVQEWNSDAERMRVDRIKLQGDNEWKDEMVDLSEAKGQQVQLIFSLRVEDQVYSGLDNIRIEDNTSSAISVEAAETQVTVNGSTINVNGAVGQQVLLYSVDGRLISSQKANESIAITAPRGIYLLSVGGMTQKIIIK
ncbi:MAG: T9SS type A sorting domain-containing protein [Bacteroidales bacterium]|nr:T9SS type A sorting domain-containing protein [Bacteroidales bacterium]